MADYGDTVLDAQLNALAAGDELHICSAEPADFAGVAAVTLGKKTAPAFSAAADSVATDSTTNGRERSIQVFSDGAATADGTVTHYALVNAAASDLLATVGLPTSKTVNNGDTFSIDAPITFIAREPTVV